MGEILSVNGLSKKHFNKKILDNVEFNLGIGRIMGIFGPNSSGKSTLLKVIAGITSYNSGEVLIGGKAVGFDTKSYVAYLPEIGCFEKWMSIKDCIRLYSSFYKDFDREKAEKMVSTYGMTTKDRISSLSKGKQEILNVIITFSRNAKLYLLDEPLASIDPMAREKIIEMFLDNFHEECSIIMVTHLIKDVGKIFDDIIFMDKGSIKLLGNVEELKMNTGKSVEEAFKEMFVNAYTS